MTQSLLLRQTQINLISNKNIFQLYFYDHFQINANIKCNNQQRQQFIILLAITINSLNNCDGMELEQSQIINLAVNIFQNVGIKRYIGQIEALRHEDIYFQIYKIIFPDSMINIFKISESNLTTGEKIQKIIQEISSIIKLDLYHISGEAIAQGNRNHLTNWLQLLQALSNNCIAYQSYNPGGSAPDRDRQIDKEFEEDDYYTVQGVYGEFQKHVYTDERPDSDSTERQESQLTDRKKKNKQKHHSHIHSSKKQKHRQPQDSFEKEQEQLNRSFRESQSSKNSNVLKPIEAKKKTSSKTKNVNKKKVTFKIDEGQNSNKNIPNQKMIKTGIKKSNQIQKNTATSLHQPGNNIRLTKKQATIFQQYGYPISVLPSKQQKLLRKKKDFISKMYKIQQEMEQKKLNDETVKFQDWAYKANAESVRDRMMIEQQNNQRTSYINKKIIQREQFINSLSGAEDALLNIKQMFVKQKQSEKRMRKVMQQQQRKQALQLMDLKFAAEVQNMVMASIGE